MLMQNIRKYTVKCFEKKRVLFEKFYFLRKYCRNLKFWVSSIIEASITEVLEKESDQKLENPGSIIPHKCKMRLLKLPKHPCYWSSNKDSSELIFVWKVYRMSEPLQNTSTYIQAGFYHHKRYF